jgi:hypothetical protein
MEWIEVKRRIEGRGWDEKGTRRRRGRVDEERRWGEVGREGWAKGGEDRRDEQQCRRLYWFRKNLNVERSVTGNRIQDQTGLYYTVLKSEM